MRKIPTTIVTGFLGAGKTSLIRHLIEQAAGRRLALLINEFGTLGIDRDLLLGCGIKGCNDENIVELANGCICCTVAEDFVPAIQKLLEQPEPPEHIIIETSGLALPKPLVQAFRWPEIAHALSVDGVITVLDATALAAGRVAADENAIEIARKADNMLDHDTPLGELFADQLACADLVVLNKADLLNPIELEAVRERIKEQCPQQVALIVAHKAAVPADVLLGLETAAEEHIDTRHTHHDAHHHDDHHHDAFNSLSVTLPESVSADAVLQALPRVIADYQLLRVKGFLHRPGMPRREVVQAVGAKLQHYFDRSWKENETLTSSLVLIAEARVDLAAARDALITTAQGKTAH